MITLTPLPNKDGQFQISNGIQLYFSLYIYIYNVYTTMSRKVWGRLRSDRKKYAFDAELRPIPLHPNRFPIEVAAKNVENDRM